MSIKLSKSTVFYREEAALSGVVIAAKNVMKDMELIFGSPISEFSGDAQTAVIYGTVGHSDILESLSAEGKISLSDISGKWEVYSISIVEKPLPGIKSAIVIAGSDKRGTIYGLYRLSELMGVSPLVNWNHVYPQKRDEILLDGIDSVSKEPSVKYRGFFINDEWPAFGNWANNRFGGINAKCYEAVFELLLRLKGNYLWPAMWGSDFSLDGPGLASAELADEMGVVMSTSHHEPCCRSGNEYGKVRGAGSKYGDAWSYLANPEGITEFWRDGLIRNSGFENVITMGMRGGPHSYQGIGSTYLPKVWEQMTMAYEYGVRQIWVTNIGDIGTQELGLSYFLDLAYDIEKWGGEEPAVTNEYRLYHKRLRAV